MEPVRQAPRHLSPRAAAKAKAPGGTPPESEQALEAQRQDFDFQSAERAELLRESNAMRDIMLAQLKADDEALKKYIVMI